MEAINGTVTRIVHVSSTGGAIFRVMLEDAARTVRVVASSKAIQVRPGEGECWGIFGDYENDRKYGHQFHAVSAVQKVPTGPLITGLFGRHQLFAEFGASVGRRLWRTLGAQVYEALNQANHSLLAQSARIAPSAAVRLVKAWRSLCIQTEVATYFATHGLPVAVAVQAIEFWGASTIQVISANPYLLASLMSWRELDGIARTSFAIAETSPPRLIAACTTVADMYFSKHANWTMPLRALQVGVKNKLGDNSLVTLATELSVAAGAILLSEASNKTVVQSRGWHILTTALTSRLSELTSYGPKPDQELYRSALPLKKGLQDVGHAARDHAKGSVTLVHLSKQDLPSLIDEPRLAGAIHLFLSTSQRDAVEILRGSGKSQLIQQFLANELNRVPESECYVIHGAEEIDVVVACKLLHALSGYPDVFFLTSMHGLGTTISTFVGSVCSTENVSLVKYVSPNSENKKSLEELESSKDDFSPGNLRYQSMMAPAVMPLAVTVDAEVQILSTYRKAISTSTAVILTNTQAAAKVFNFTLHEEQTEVRKFERLPTPVVRLANDYVATIGDTLVCHQSDYKRGLVAGSTGKIIDITQPIALAGDGSANTALVRAFIEDRKSVV